MSSASRSVVLGLAAAGLLVAGIALPGLRHVLGPVAASMAWLPAFLMAASLAVLALGHRRASAVTGLAARIALLLLAIAVALDPADTLLDDVARHAGAAAGAAGEGARRVLVAVVGIAFGGFVLVQLLSGRDDAPSTRTTVRAGGGTNPVLGLLLRAVARSLLLLLAAASWLVLLLAGWLVLGWWRLRISLAAWAADDGSLMARVLAVRRRLLAAGFGMAGSAWGTRRGPEHGVWVRPAWIERDIEGDLIDSRDWEPARNPVDDELREWGESVLVSLDTALLEGQRGADPRTALPPAPPYRIEVRRAWSQPGYHAAVIGVTPPRVAARAARTPVEQLVPVIDGMSRWTTDELRGLKLSDARVAADPLRGGEVGLYIALDRQVDAAEPEDPRPMVVAVNRALAEAGLLGTFRLHALDESAEADVVEYRASWRTSSEWRSLEAAWKGLEPAVSLFTKRTGVRLESRLEPSSFLAIIPRPVTAFPSGEAVALEPVLARYAPVLRSHPLRFIVGLDQRGEPVYADLGDESPHWLWAGATGSGKSRSMFSVLTQLMAVRPPELLEVWLLDSVKRELTTVFGEAPHIGRLVVAEDADDVVRTVEDFVDAMDAQYRSLAGREVDPRREQVRILVVEEFADMCAILSKAEMERVVRAVQRAGNVGRASGFRVLLCTQRATVEVLPGKIRSSLRGRVCGHLASAAEYGVVLGEHRQVLENVRGRLAVSTGSGITVCQGLYADNTTIRRLVSTRDGRRQAPHAPAPVAGWPSQSDIDRLDGETLLRLLHEWHDEAGEITVSVRGLVDRIRALDLVAGRQERLTDALAELEDVGALERTGDHPTASRRLVHASLEASLDCLHAAREVARAPREGLCPDCIPGPPQEGAGQPGHRPDTTGPSA